MLDRPGIDSENPTLKLRTGRSVWELDGSHPSAPSPINCPRKTDILIVGAGIIGSFLAERLTRIGKSVVVFDRHCPHTASTAASTALLQWEIDAPMLGLEARLGFEAASLIYRRSYAAVQTIGGLVGQFSLKVDFQPRQTLYLAGNKLGKSALAEEHALREKAGLPGHWMERDALLSTFGFQREAAILSEGSAEADPILLAKTLLDIAVKRGAQIFYLVTIKDYDTGSKTSHVATDQGFEVEASIIILANGYEMPGFAPSTQHRLASTWALATVPQLPSHLWPQRPLVWEASEPYAYFRTTADNRIIIGGEDEDLTDEKIRDAKIPEKVSTLLRKLSDFVPGANLEVDAA
jgi:glycine/D-amino acid oxidase-like deaminating enzyme